MAEYPEPLFPQIPHMKKKAFLAAFAHCGRIRRACQAAQVDWKSHYLWLANDPDYAAAFAEATRMAGDFLEDEAIRRALEGVQKPIFYRGEHVDNQTEYSDTLLIFTLKAAKPEKYRETFDHHHSGTIEHVLTTTLHTALEQAEKSRNGPKQLTP